MERDTSPNYHMLISPPPNLEDPLQEDSVTEVQNYGNPSSHIPLLREKVSFWMLPLYCLCLVLCTSGLVILLPPYLEAINVVGDAYSALLFVSLFTSLPYILYIQLRSSYFCQFARLGPSSPLRIMKYGFWHGVSILMMTYSLDRKRVYCHIQEPMMGLVIMYMIVVYFVYKGPELSSLKMLCLCGVLAGLFLCMDFQMNDIFKCHGNTRFHPADDGGNWNSETHTLWMIAFAGFLLLFTISWLWMEREILRKKTSEMSLRIVNTVSNNVQLQGTDTEALLNVNQDSSESSVGPLLPSTYTTILNKWDYTIVWFLLGSLLTVILLLWTDWFCVIGKGDSAPAFANLTSSGLSCHFHIGGKCGLSAVYGWLYVIFYLSFFVSLGAVFAHSGSMIFSLSVASLALPISSFWWSLFKAAGPYGLVWNPQVTGELVFSLLGVPVIVICLLYWAHLDKRKGQNDNFLMSHTSSINHV